MHSGKIDPKKKKKNPEVKAPLKLVHTDLAGPLSTESLGASIPAGLCVTERKR